MQKEQKEQTNLKNILFPILLVVFTLGLYGCSCSQSSKNDSNAAPGLYLGQFSVAEGNSGGKATVNFSVTLQRENSDDITVSYAVSAIDPTGRSAEDIADFAVVGDGSDPTTDVIAKTGSITFAAGDSDVAQVSIELIGDTLYEHDEKFQITLSAASGAKIVKGSLEAVIANDDATPIISMVTSTASIGEVFSGVGFAAGISTDSPNNADLTITIDKVSRVDTTVVISALSTASSPADYRVDYLLLQDGNVIYSNVPVVIPAGETTIVVTLAVVDDGIAEADEGFQLKLASPVDAVLESFLGTALVFTVADNDSTAQTKMSKVNDTGLLQVASGLSSTQEAEVDANKGLDKTLLPENKIGAGRAGFDYTRFDVSGVETTDAITFDGNTRVVPWECVKDNVSGLVWEVKTQLGLRAEGHKYFWYEPNAAMNGGDRGAQGNDICEDDLLSNECSTAHYVADVNQVKLCGMTGWRLPTIDELRTLVDYGVSSSGVKVVSYDTDYFAGDTVGGGFVWSSTTDAQSSSKARTIRFGFSGFSEESRPKDKANFSSVRLVNDSFLVAQ